MREVLLAPALLLLVGLLVLASLTLGYLELSPLAWWRGVWAGDPLLRLVLVEIRLPRTLLALAVGAALGVAGAALQSLLRNPLAEPALVGATGGASLGAVMALYWGWAGAWSLALPLAGFAGAALVTAFVLLLALRGASTVGLILAGVAASSLSTALVSLILNASPNPHATMEIVHWLLGSVADRSLQDVALVLPPIALGMALLLRQGTALRRLVLDEEAAASLGVSLPRLRLAVLVGAALAVGAATAIAGSIGFVGLVAPHLVRPLVRHDPARTLWASMGAGAVLLLAADLAVRLIDPHGAELKLGVLTALVGAPFFLWRVLAVRAP